MEGKGKGIGAFLGRGLFWDSWSPVTYRRILSVTSVRRNWQRGLVMWKQREGGGPKQRDPKKPQITFVEASGYQQEGLGAHENTAHVSCIARSFIKNVHSCCPTRVVGGSERLPS